MPAPKNEFKAHLHRKNMQIGLWLALAEATTAEICADAGFDWLVIDAEHGPNELRDILDQLRVIGSKSHPVVRIPVNDRAGIKRMLDIGAQTILVPMIETVEEAREAALSMRYPPDGVRGVGAALARASQFGRIPDYLHTANDEVCLLLQVESVRGIEALDGILELDGIDGVFVGPADLAADMGFRGKPGSPEVQKVVEESLAKIAAAGRARGILTSDPTLIARYAELGVEFLAIGSDLGALTNGLRAIRAQVG